MQNIENGHCHFLYALETPICKTNNAKPKPLDYFSKIEHTYTEKLNADPDFGGLLTKNPNSKKWRVTVFPISLYSLNHLADFVDLPPKIPKKEAVGVGRNCILFDAIRKFAYKNVLFYKENGAKMERIGRQNKRKIRVDFKL